ncbi:putative phosphoserine aminotransferase [Ceratocystis fimbriata CBS 114723]|uniref:phosphoserine transaminase n=1 Tax=Ceratocystis fimbriata CBS 114723 TaxID=1035309 RepID=A0A2C5WVW8_9PEZI|nr:putative phosphoserine aminotransferase [Ceratocystis fimbriata CBS 114723]
MPSRSEITYFGAGPALLPTDVLEDAAKALVNFQDTGLGIAEHSHRSEIANNILNTAKADLASYLDIPAGYEILFMQGGGTGEFAATTYNLIGNWVARKKAAIESQIGAGEAKEAEVLAALKKAVDEELKLDYIVTGGWSDKAAKEAARLVGPEFVNVAADSRTTNNGKFGTIPAESEWKLSDSAAFVYYCDNETVDGVEFPGFPSVLEPRGNGSEGPIVIADMSSNILSRRVPVDKFSVIFFGAQKNLGAAGVTGVIIKKDLLAQPSPSLLRQLGLPVCPIVFSYEAMAKNNSLYNTLSIFDVYICGQVLQKLLRVFPSKAAGQEELASRKAALIYAALDAHPEAYQVVPDKSVRSRMNICFCVIKGVDADAAEKAFLKESTALGLTGLKGHRSVGGIRASNYNSISLEGAEKLAQFINNFAT